MHPEPNRVITSARSPVTPEFGEDLIQPREYFQHHECQPDQGEGAQGGGHASQCNESLVRLGQHVPGAKTDEPAIGEQDQHVNGSHTGSSSEQPEGATQRHCQVRALLGPIVVELTRLLAEVPAGAVALDTEAPRARKLDRIEALMVVNHGATVAWSRSGGEIEMAGIAAHSEFGRVALFRAWLRAACLAIAAEIPA